ncbi:3'-5' exoribonuclease 1 [Merluccius polli]|uniref:3'-5' exoribonuclease 1 n=1 Tax=Merluccius polli TaxID=89951 RepID=A0AA47N7W2_MERPO|nr:3'-5' exoribonuclease 1 [Merluccius polli]
MDDHKENMNGLDVNVKMSSTSSTTTSSTTTSENEKPDPCTKTSTTDDSDPPACAPQTPSDFSDPVYKEIALANGHINRMTKDELRVKLSELKLDTRGVKDVMKKRLKSHYKKQKLMQSVGGRRRHGHLLRLHLRVDFEATCEEDNPAEFHHEIIEFPMVLINTHTLEIEDTFQEYVRPEVNTQLSDFCVKLTGITQKMVDEADTFSSPSESGALASGAGAWNKAQIRPVD